MTKNALVFESNKEEPILYVKLYKRILQEADLSGFVPIKTVSYTFGVYFRISKSEKFFVLREMMDLGFIKKITPRGVWLKLSSLQ